MKTFDTHQLRNHAEDFIAEMDSYGEEIDVSNLLSFIDFLDGFEVAPIEGEAEGLKLEEFMTSCSQCGDFFEGSHVCS